MGKLLPALVVVLMINVILTFFLGQTIPGSSLWTFLQSPTDWSNNSLISFLSDTLVLVGAGLIVVGTIWIKNDFVIYAGIASVFLSFGSTLYNLWQYIAGHALFAPNGDIIALLFVSPFLLGFIYVIIEFWRGRD